MSEKKKVALGYEDLKVIIENNIFYADKTPMLEEFIKNHGYVTLFTRPRRFGKTLCQSMFQRFFEDERLQNGEKVDNRWVFDDLYIGQREDLCRTHQQQYPVINLSLKSGKQSDFQLAYDCLLDDIAQEYDRHSYILCGDALTGQEKQRYDQIRHKEANAVDYVKSLYFLSVCLEKFHRRKCIVLIDEYDVPLENAWACGFYDDMIGFIRPLFESVLKTNRALEFAVVTGCLRISRESIFTGLNNLDVNSILQPRYGYAYGFTEEEVQQILRENNLEEKFPEVKAWYDGYRFGDLEIYNPWSILNYVVEREEYQRESFPKPYWSNTSSNSIVRELIEKADEETRRALEKLMDGGAIEKPIHEEITYGDIYASQENLWNFLYFTGYLKAGRQRMEEDVLYLELAIPNREIKTIYRQSILAWMKQSMASTDRSQLLEALETGDCQGAELFISEKLMDTISYFDYAENFYHGFMTGLLTGAGQYDVESNREKGLGRADIVMTERKFRGRAMVIELKVAETFGEMTSKCQEALEQIERQQYARPLQEDGYSPVLKYGISFYKKGCMVKKAE